jgi:hypothetical protein
VKVCVDSVCTTEEFIIDSKTLEAACDASEAGGTDSLRTESMTAVAASIASDSPTLWYLIEPILRSLKN